MVVTLLEIAPNVGCTNIIYTYTSNIISTGNSNRNHNNRIDMWFNF